MKTKNTFAYRILALGSIVMMLMFASCVKNEFKVDFQFPKDHIGNYMLTYYARDSHGGRWIEHTASIQEGMAAVGGITRLPTLVYVSDASQPGNSIAFYVERGDEITISGDGKDMGAWRISGNKLSERWSEWRRSAYQKKKDSGSLEKSIGEYVKSHPEDELSSILLLTEWDRRSNPDGFVALWNSIRKDSRGRELVEMCGVADLLGTSFITAADGSLESVKDPGMKTLVLRSRDNGTDTLRFNKVSFLYFYTENNSARREALDSIKALSKAYPDSAKRVIADIYMNSDSITWVNAIRRDSLKGAVRAWQPRGLAESDIEKVGVSRLPWFVVKDRTAKEVYAGPDLKDATAAFRKAAGKPDAKKTAAVKPEKSEKPVKPVKPQKNTK